MRTPSETDGRSWNIALTPKGQGLRPDFQAISATLLGKTCRNLAPSEQESLMELLDRVLINLEDLKREGKDR